MLEKDFLYYARVRYNGVNGSQSPWSSSFSFKASAIDTPSFLVPNDVTTSIPYFTVGLSPFSGGSLTKIGGVIEAHTTPDFNNLLFQSSIDASSDYAEIQIGNTNLTSYYIRFKYIASNGAESNWSTGKKITYSPVAEGVTINNLNLKISQFTLVDGGQVDFTVLASQSFLLQSVSSVVIKPDGSADIFNFTPSSGNTTSFIGSGNIGYLSNGSYELRVNVKCKDLVTNEIHTFPLKSSNIYPPLSVNTPTVTSSKTSIAQQGEAAYPNGLPPYTINTYPSNNGGSVILMSPSNTVSWDRTGPSTYSISHSLNTTIDNNDRVTINKFQITLATASELRVILEYTFVGSGNFHSQSFQFTTTTTQTTGLASYPSGLPSYVAPYKYFNLTSSAFNGNWSQTHASTEWQISTNNSFPNFFQSTTVSSGNKLVLRTNNMNSSTTYYARCRYRSDAGVYSSWSPTITLS